MIEQFTKPFTQQEAIPEEGIERAVEILRSGRLHRYNVAAGEEADASYLEQEYAVYQGVKYCVATASGGQAIQLGLRVCGVNAGDKVLANAYTLAPVPGAIHGIGAEPVLVEIDQLPYRHVPSGRDGKTLWCQGAIIVTYAWPYCRYGCAGRHRTPI